MPELYHITDLENNAPPTPMMDRFDIEAALEGEALKRLPMPRRRHEVGGVAIKVRPAITLANRKRVAP